MIEEDCNNTYIHIKLLVPDISKTCNHLHKLTCKQIKIKIFDTWSTNCQPENDQLKTTNLFFRQ